jgi:hypothetical protein
VEETVAPVADEADDLAADASPEAVDDDAVATTEDAPVESTGVASVDAAIERLRDLEGAPVEGHVEIFDDVQRRLHDALAELDDGQ